MALRWCLLLLLLLLLLLALGGMYTVHEWGRGVARVEPHSHGTDREDVQRRLADKQRRPRAMVHVHKGQLREHGTQAREMRTYTGASQRVCGLRATGVCVSVAQP